MASTLEAVAKLEDVHSVEDNDIDIEHVTVDDDPRSWSPARKNVILAIVSIASMIASLAANIQSPAIAQMEADLPATSAEISLSISLFILPQGIFPLVWSGITEIKGRKMIYVVSLTIFTAGSVAIAVSKSIGLVIGFRILQAVGSSAVLTIGAGTLADIFDPHERGMKVGIYYLAPSLGPSLAPLLSGLLTQGFNWRAPFWFLTALSALSVLAFIFFFKDTFRRQRSRTYQLALMAKMFSVNSRPTLSNPNGNHPKTMSEKSTAVKATPDFDDIRLSLKDVNPFHPLWLILRRWNNVATLFASGFLFALCFSIPYTSSRTLSAKYSYNPLQIGLVLLAFGVGSVAGSFCGGFWSDRTLVRLSTKNGGHSEAEMRMKSIILGMLFLPPSVLGFAWVSEKRVHISGMCVMLFLCGFFAIWIYSSLLAYTVDSNNGRSSSAVAANSAFRGIAAFVATEIAVPLQASIFFDNLGDGWLYTIWAAVMVLCVDALLVLVIVKGSSWRKDAEARELKARNITAQNSAL